MKAINLEHLYAIPAFEQAFKAEKDSGLAESFLGEVNASVSKDAREIIGCLLKSACEYKVETPLYRTIFLDLAWAVLENNRSLWSKEEKADGYSDIDSHWILYPEYDGSFDDYESVILSPTDYFEGVMALMSEDEFLYISFACFALYIFFVQCK